MAARACKRCKQKTCIAKIGLKADKAERRYSKENDITNESLNQQSGQQEAKSGTLLSSFT